MKGYFWGGNSVKTGILSSEKSFNLKEQNLLSLGKEVYSKRADSNLT